MEDGGVAEAPVEEPQQGHGHSEVIGDFPEISLEPIDDEGGGDGGGGGGGEPPVPLNFDELLDRMTMLKNRKFKFPTLAKFMFNAELSSEDTFYKHQVPLVLYNRLAKNTLKKKDALTAYEAELFRSFCGDYYKFLKFLTDSLIYSNTGSGGYYIDADKNLSALGKLQENPAVNVIGGEDVGLPLSVNGIIDLIEQIRGQDDPNISPEQMILQQMAFGVLLTMVVNSLEQMAITDDYMYRIVSLSAFYKTSMFQDDFLVDHADYLFNFFHERDLGLGTDPTAPFRMLELKTEDITQLRRNGDFEIYHLFRPIHEDDYDVFQSKNYSSISAREGRTYFEKKKLSEIDETSAEFRHLFENFRSFYDFCINLQASEGNRKMTLKNLINLANLHTESYKAFLLSLRIELLD